MRPDGRTEVDRVVQRVSQEVAGCSGPDETKPNTEDMNKSIEEMIRKNRVNVFVTVAVQQSVVPDCVEAPLTSCPTSTHRSTPTSQAWFAYTFP